MPDAPETLVGVEVSPVGKYLLCALGGAVVGIVLGFTLATLISTVDSLPENATITPIRPREGIRVFGQDEADQPDDDPDELGDVDDEENQRKLEEIAVKFAQMPQASPSTEE